MKMLFMFLATAFILSSCNKEVNKSDIVSSENLNYSIISEGELSGEEGVEKQGVVIKNQGEFDDLLGDLRLSNSDLIVDFDNEQVVVVVTDLKTTSGYSIELLHVMLEEDVVKVNVLENSGLDGGDATVMTQPYIIFKMTKLDNPVEFIWW